MLSNFLKTKEQELEEVVAGKKPSALGYWESLPEGILSQRLFAVYGRFYDMAIAKTQENLNRLVRAYYMPLNKESDIELGNALGYSKESIEEYLATQFYPEPLPDLSQKERTVLKVNATIQKVGLETAKKELKSFQDGNEFAKHLVEKEDIDINIAEEILA